jgi:hypothetical protein
VRILDSANLRYSRASALIWDGVGVGDKSDGDTELVAGVPVQEADAASTSNVKAIALARALDIDIRLSASRPMVAHVHHGKVGVTKPVPSSRRCSPAPGADRCEGEGLLGYSVTAGGWRSASHGAEPIRMTPLGFLPGTRENGSGA